MECVRITSIGHAGLHLDTAAGSILCDPWFSPAYFASWFPFPANDQLDEELMDAGGHSRLPVRLAPAPGPLRPDVPA